MSTAAPTLTPPEHFCPNSQRKWYVFLASSLITFFGGLFIIVTVRLFTFCCGIIKKKLRSGGSSMAPSASGSLFKSVALHKSDGSAPFEWIVEVKDWANELISAQSITGRILVVLVFFLSIASLGVYIHEATVYPGVVENCTPWSKSVLNQVDLAFNIVFLMYFWLRFVAAQDKLWYWLEMYTIIEFCTIPPSFVNIYLDQSWLGLRFMRALRIMSLPDVLQYLNILKSGTTIRFFQLITIFLSIWLGGAGAYHLLENSGDPHQEFKNAQALTFGDCLYYAIVTMSTVGYGDISPKTDWGKAYVVVYILFTLSIFASFLPEIANIVTSRSKYSGSYKKEHGRRHIVVCGDISYESVDSFLTDFLHKDREDTDIDILFLNTMQPNIEFESLLKRHFGQVAYFEGTVMNPNDCKRVCLDEASATIILANKYSPEPDAEDASNIMRVLSVKNYSCQTRCIVQILQYANKGYLVNIPFWDWKCGDEVVCIQEIKLGFLAQSCLAPGFSTMIGNLYSTRSDSENPENNQWQKDYERGSAMEIYSEFFSSSFFGLTFNEAVELCFTKLNIILFAVEAVNSQNEKFLSLNPGKKVVIYKKCQGFFIADSQEEVRRVFYYCALCHRDVHDPVRIKKCTCGGVTESTPGSPFEEARLRGASANIRRPDYSSALNLIHSARHSKAESDDESQHEDGLTTLEQELQEIGTEEGADYFDLTGMFHWCPDRNFDDCVIDPSTSHNIRSLLKGHFIMAVFADADSPPLGLRSFIMPLRASSFLKSEIKPIVLIGNRDYLEKEWFFIKNYPHIYVFKGSPMNRVLLRNAQINSCDMCVIVSAKCTFNANVDPYMLDKEVVLCSLNIRAMSFVNTTDDTNPLMEAQIQAFQGNNTQIKSFLSKLSVPILVELFIDENLQFLDQDDNDTMLEEIYTSQPYACGSAFTAGVLDSLMSTVFYNVNAMTLIRTLITGGATGEMELLMAEGLNMDGVPTTPEIERNRSRARVQQLSLVDPRIAPFNQSTFGELFSGSLHNHGVLCLGLYRYRDSYDPLMEEPTTKRVVITSPPSEFRIIPSDLVFCLTPYRSASCLNIEQRSNAK